MLASLVTAAVSVVVSVPSIVVDNAVTETPINGLMVTVTEPDLVLSATEVAVSVTD